MANLHEGKKHHFIYKTTNLTNGKYYIGMHSTNNLNDGYLGSGKKLRRSINKYGVENFKCEILEFLTNRDLLANREKEIVNKDLLKDPMCMNLKEGGSGGFVNNNHKEAFINAGKLNLINSKDKRNTSLAKVKSTKRYKDTMSRALTEYFKTHDGNFTNKNHSVAAKQKISDSLKGKNLRSNNSQFGTCWITNGIETKKIKKTELNIYLTNNWSIGRTVNLKKVDHGK